MFKAKHVSRKHRWRWTTWTRWSKGWGKTPAWTLKLLEYFLLIVLLRGICCTRIGKHLDVTGICSMWFWSSRIMSCNDYVCCYECWSPATQLRGHRADLRAAVPRLCSSANTDARDQQVGTGQRRAMFSAVWSIWCRFHVSRLICSSIKGALQLCRPLWVQRGQANAAGWRLLVLHYTHTCSFSSHHKLLLSISVQVLMHFHYATGRRPSPSW